MIQRIEKIQDLRQYVRNARQAGKTIGYVATMGYLHEGHMRLVQEARHGNDVVIASVFVNPLQFGPNEDFATYPRDLARDEKMLDDHGCDVLFAPSVEEMYPIPMATAVVLPEFSQKLCGKTRPTHFQGVATVVCKFFNIVQPDKAYFGQKDGQQVAVLQRMVADLSIPVEIVVVPIVRESDGLAKSSRNTYLTADERPHATILYRALKEASDKLQSGETSVETIVQGMRERISGEPSVRLDYAEAVDMTTLESVKSLDGFDGRVMLAVAAFLGKPRLIDNVQLVFEHGRVVSSTL